MHREQSLVSPHCWHNTSPTLPPLSAHAKHVDLTNETFAIISETNRRGYCILKFGNLELFNSASEKSAKAETSCAFEFVG